MESATKIYKLAAINNKYSECSFSCVRDFEEYNYATFLKISVAYKNLLEDMRHRPNNISASAALIS